MMVVFDHDTCSGGVKKRNARAVAQESAVFVNTNRKISLPSLRGDNEELLLR